MTQTAEEVPDAPGAVADRIALCVRPEPIGSQSIVAPFPWHGLKSRWPMCPHVFEFLGDFDLLPEVQAGQRVLKAWLSLDAIDETQHRTGEILGFEPLQRLILGANYVIVKQIIGDDRVNRCRHFCRILVGDQNAAAVHRGGHRSGGVGYHRHAHVKRLDERHAETLRVH